MLIVVKLPNDLDSELNLPRRGRGTINQAGATDRATIRVKECTVVNWRLEIGVVEYVEKLSTKLHVQTVRKFGERYEMVFK